VEDVGSTFSLLFINVSDELMLLDEPDFLGGWQVLKVQSHEKNPPPRHRLIEFKQGWGIRTIQVTSEIRSLSASP
jgi:hypothetical protein